jgi:hypothetical protein
MVIFFKAFDRFYLFFAGLDFVKILTLVCILRLVAKLRLLLKMYFSFEVQSKKEKQQNYYLSDAYLS